MSGKILNTRQFRHTSSRFNHSLYIALQVLQITLNYYKQATTLLGLQFSYQSNVLIIFKVTVIHQCHFNQLISLVFLMLLRTCLYVLKSVVHMKRNARGLSQIKTFKFYSILHESQAYVLFLRQIFVTVILNFSK